MTTVSRTGINGWRQRDDAAAASRTGLWGWYQVRAPLSGPTIGTQPTAQTANEGAAATFTVSATGTGALSYQWKRQAPGGGAFSNVGTNSASYTTATLDCATDHLANFYVDVTDDNGTTTSSTVGLTVRSVTTVCRPSADVSGAGWTPSTGLSLFGTIDEVTATSTDYAESPTITSTPEWMTVQLAYPIAAGDRVVSVQAWVPSGTGTLKARLLDDSDSVMGTAADQAITGTETVYDLAVTTSGTATRLSLAIVT